MYAANDAELAVKVVLHQSFNEPSLFARPVTNEHPNMASVRCKNAFVKTRRNHIALYERKVLSAEDEFATFG